MTRSDRVLIASVLLGVTALAGGLAGWRHVIVGPSDSRLLSPAEWGAHSPQDWLSVGVADGLLLGSFAVAAVLIVISGRRMLGLVVPVLAVLRLDLHGLQVVPLGDTWSRSPLREIDGVLFSQAPQTQLWVASALTAVLAALPALVLVLVARDRDVQTPLIGWPRLVARLALPVTVVVGGSLLQRTWGQGDPYHPQLAVAAVVLAGLVATGPQPLRRRCWFLVVVLLLPEQVRWPISRLLLGDLPTALNALEPGRLLTTTAIVFGAGACAAFGPQLAARGTAWWVAAFRHPLPVKRLSV